MPTSPSDDQRSFIERARREQIVRATIEVIAAEGLARATFARIARHTGISPGLISYHFTEKSELLRTVAGTVMADMEAALSAASDGVESHGGALTALLRAQVSHAAAHLAELTALAAIRAAGVAPVEAQRSTALDAVEQLLRDGQAAGGFGAFDTRVMAVTLLAAMEAVPTELAANPDMDVDVYATELAAAFDRATQS